MISLTDFNKHKKELLNFIKVIERTSIPVEDKLEVIEEILGTIKDISGLDGDGKNCLDVKYPCYEFTVCLNDKGKLTLDPTALLYNLMDDDLEDVEKAQKFDRELRTLGGYVLYNWEKENIYFHLTSTKDKE